MCLLYVSLQSGATVVCGLRLHTISYTEELDCIIISDNRKPSENTEAGQLIGSDHDDQVTRRKFDCLYDWSSNQVLEFNAGKCSILNVWQ